MDGKRAKIRSFSNVPIIMVTARDQTIDVVQGLKLGADDYVTKPFHEEELFARIEAVLRRTNTRKYNIMAFYGMRQGISFLYIMKNFFHSNRILFTRIILRHVNYVLSRDQLIERIWGLNTNTEDRTVDSHIRNLRDKLRKVNFLLIII